MAVIDLGPGDDVYVFASPGDLINGLGGNDILAASSGGNQLFGGDGSDVLNGGAGNDVLSGDTAPNFTYSNVLRGLGGDDTIIGSSALDQINAGSGDDSVTVGFTLAGQIIIGGLGQDRLNLRIQGDEVVQLDVTFALSAAFSVSVDGEAGAVFRGFEAVTLHFGPGSHDIVTGDAVADFSFDVKGLVFIHAADFVL